MATPTESGSYAPHIDSDFVVHLPDGTTRTLKFTAVKSHISDEIQECYSLLFLAEGDPLPQHLFRLTHAQLGELDLFLVPIQKKRTGIVYEAVFNLLKAEEQ